MLREALAEFADRIDAMFVFGSMARGEATSASDLDLMVIGTAGLRELARIRRVEAALHREVNPVTLSAEDFAERVASGAHFVASVLREPKIFLIGDENELERLAARGPAAPA